MPQQPLRRSARNTYTNKYKKIAPDDDDCVVITEIKEGEHFEDSEPQSEPIIEEEEEVPVQVPKQKALKRKVPKRKVIPAAKPKRRSTTRSQKHVVFEDFAEDEELLCLSESVPSYEQTTSEQVHLVVEETEQVDIPTDAVTFEEIFHHPEEGSSQNSEDNDDPFRPVLVNGINIPQMFMPRNRDLLNRPSQGDKNEARGTAKAQKSGTSRDDSGSASQVSEEIELSKDLELTREVFARKLELAALTGITFKTEDGTECDFRSAESLDASLKFTATAPTRLEGSRMIRKFFGGPAEAQCVDSATIEECSDSGAEDSDMAFGETKENLKAKLRSCTQV